MNVKTETQSDTLRAAQDKLQDAVAEVVSSDDWKRMLKVASKFHRYSFNDHQVEPLSVGPPVPAATRSEGRPLAKETEASRSALVWPGRHPRRRNQMRLLRAPPAPRKIPRAK